MFLSVRERALQIASGQFTTQPSADQVHEPVAPPKTAPPKTAPSKAAPPKAAPPKAAPPKAVPPPKVASSRLATPKTESAKSASPKTASPKTATSKAASSKNAPQKTTPSKVVPSETAPSKTVSPKSSSPRSTPSKSVSPKTKNKASKITPTKITSSKSVPSTPVRSSFFPKVANGSLSGSSADDEAPIHACSGEIADLKAACLKQVRGVTGLGGRNLTIVLRQTSSNSQWYAALKDLSSDKYLKIWMNRSKTFSTQIEALRAYLDFVKRMKEGCRLFPMSRTAGKSK